MLLTVNAGSSSVRVALHAQAPPHRRTLAAMLERIGQPRPWFSVSDASGAVTKRQLSPRQNAIPYLMDWMEHSSWFASVSAVGHRVVHGMEHRQPARVSARLVADLRRAAAIDPDHLPRELELMELFAQRHPGLAQFACFDTAFHARMPDVAQRIALPRRLAARGVRRYGFHGISYSYLMRELRTQDPRAARGRVILAHLGSGASLAAVRAGRPLDTTMGFTPASGLVMGTRSGDLDPGLPYFLARSERMSPARFHHMVNHESGLLGLSGTSSDMRDLCARAARDRRAADAVESFCYQVAKSIGALAVVLGGLDTLVFSAGIGEHSPEVRARICAGLALLGVRLGKRSNQRTRPVISSGASRVTVRVIPTDEELMIARSMAALRRSQKP